MCFIHRFPKSLLGAEEYHTWSYGPVLGPPFHLPIFPSLPRRRLQNSLGTEEYHAWNYGPVLGPPFHLSIFPSLCLRRLSLLLAPLLAPTHTSPPSFVSLLLFFWRSRSLGFSLFFFFLSLMVSLL